MSAISEFLKLIFGDQFHTDEHARPCWRPPSRNNRMKRSGGKGPGRKREVSFRNTVQVEEFTDKDKRNERFRQLREKKTPDLVKFSTNRDGKDLWCVAHN